MIFIAVYQIAYTPIAYICVSYSICLIFYFKWWVSYISWRTVEQISWFCGVTQSLEFFFLICEFKIKNSEIFQQNLYHIFPFYPLQMSYFVKTEGTFTSSGNVTDKMIVETCPMKLNVVRMNFWYKFQIIKKICSGKASLQMQKFSYLKYC